jgi:hypothetical protein
LGGNREKVYFDALESSGDLKEMPSRPWFKSLVSWMNGKQPTTGYTVERSVINLWSYLANSPDVDETLRDLARLGEVVALGELCEILRGIPTRGASGDSGDIPIIRGTDLKDGYVDFENVRKVNIEEPPEHAFLKPGDVLLPSIMSDRFSPVLNSSEETALISNQIYALRITDERVSPEYIWQYLKSSTARNLLLARAVRGTIPHISISALRNLQVPVIDDPSMLGGLSEIRGIQSELRSKADELESSSKDLFEAKNIQVFRNNVSDLKQLARITSESVVRAKSLDFQIANFYPFPIAYGYRLISGMFDPRERYTEQLRIAENLLAFLASVSLTLLQKQDREEAHIDVQKIWQGGISPGDWRDIIKRCSDVFKTYQDFPLASQIVRLNISSGKKGIGPSADLLIRVKNDFKPLFRPNK